MHLIIANKKLSPLNERGFTLMEAIAYLSILIIISGLVSAFTITLIKNHAKMRAERQTYQEAYYALNRIINRIRLAPGVDTGNSDFTSTIGQLVLKSPTVATNLTRFYVQNGRIYEKIGSQDAEPITSPRMNVAEMRFSQVVSSTTQSSIQIALALNYNNLGRAELTAGTELTANASLRNNYPYSWIQTDWSGGPGQDLWSNVKQYQSGSNLDVGTCSGDAMLGNDPEEIVIHVSQVCDLHGFFHKEADATAADGIRIVDMPNLGLRGGGHFGNAPEINPAHYFDISFNALSGTVYHVWGRFKVAAETDLGTSDSTYLQFSDSVDENGSPLNQIGGNRGLVPSYGSNQSWGWDDIWTGIDTDGEIFYLVYTGAHTMRVQRREDGFSFDQFVISSSDYMSNPPSNSAILPLTYASPALLASSAFDTGAPSVFGQIKWVDYTPDNTDIKFQLRTAPDNAGAPGAWGEWLGPTDASDYYTAPDVGINYAHDGDQWIQYQATLTSTDPEITPILNAVEISYSN